MLHNKYQTNNNCIVNVKISASPSSGLLHPHPNVLCPVWAIGMYFYMQEFYSYPGIHFICT